MYKLVSDSSCDMYTMGNIPFNAVPLKISTDHHSWTDDENMNIHEMLDVLENYKGRSYTSCPNVDDWMNAFEGGDPVYAVTITSGLSGSYNSAMTARDIYLEAHPEAKIHVFDSLSTGPHMRLILEKIAELAEQGLPFEEVVEKVNEYKKHVHLFYALHSVHNLAQNGRVSNVVAAAVGVIKIRIFGTASPEGTLQPISKVRGDKKLIGEYMKALESVKCKGGKFRITSAENPELAEMLKNKILEKYPDADITVGKAGGLDSFYGERHSTMLAVEDGLE